MRRLALAVMVVAAYVWTTGLPRHSARTRQLTSRPAGRLPAMAATTTVQEALPRALGPVVALRSTAPQTKPAAPAGLAGGVVDLGHPLAESDPSWTGQKGFTWTLEASLEKEGYFAGRFSTSEHFGTHLDAPAHFAPKGWTVDEIPTDRLVRPAVTINIEDKVRTNEDYQLLLADVRAFEERHGPIPEGAVVLVATGWDKRWIEPRKYMNERAGVKHFPGVSPEAAAYLARTRKIAGLGIDTPSVDYGPSQKFETHRTTQPLNVYHIENATRLTMLPPGGFTVVVAPLKIRGGSGGPARVFALLAR